MSRTGPLTKDTTTIAIGLAQVRVGASTTYIGQLRPILAASASLGALANTKFSSNVEMFKLESGFPMLEDAVYPLRESASFELAFKEFTPKNFALARGLDPTSYTDVHNGMIKIGNIVAPTYIRLEVIYTFPDGVNTMKFVFPRAQAVAVVEAEFSEDTPAAVGVKIEAKRADSDASGGHIIWNDKPLGYILWDDSTAWTTTTTTTTTTTAA